PLVKRAPERPRDQDFWWRGDVEVARPSVKDRFPLNIESMRSCLLKRMLYGNLPDHMDSDAVGEAFDRYIFRLQLDLKLSLCGLNNRVSNRLIGLGFGSIRFLFDQIFQLHLLPVQRKVLNRKIDSTGND